jgi:vancomycin resistance protein YoaR
MHFPPPRNPHVRPASSAAAPRTLAASPKGHRWGLRLALAGTLLATLGVATLVLRARYLPDAAVLPGLAIDGERVADGADAAAVKALVAARAERLSGRKVRLVLPGEAKAVHESTLGELGVRVDIDRTAALATRLGKSGDVWSRALLAERARKGEVDVPLVTFVDAAAATPILEALKEREDTMPVSARLDLDKHETIKEKDGRYIDADGALARLESSARAPRGGDQAKEATTIELPVATFAPRISSAFLKNLDISAVVAEYETHFSRGGDQQKRGKNIDNAAQKLDGLVISPGEMISFNQVVGERSEANGFFKSWEIFKGEMVEGMGGGTCQVASTFHAATFFGGLDVLERLPHSRPSAYIPMGLDSTVVFPAVDLKVRNPHPFPVVIHAKTEGGKLKVEVLGKMRPVQVGFGREVLETLPYKRKVVEEASLSGKKVLVKQHGIKGYRVKRSRLLTYPDGTTKKESTTDVYPPTTEIYQVPVGFDVALLPALPGGGEEGDNPSAAPAAARTPSTAQSNPSQATACTDCSQSADAVQFVDAPGAHAPTTAQKDPAKTIWMKR